ncbi:serine/threonine-protein kinase [Lachnospiraceae bacterium 46-15]
METQEKRHLEPGTVLDERYTIEKILGEGGFGVTYQAKNQRVGISVAIKEFAVQDQKARDKIRKEAHILGDLINLENIARVIDYFEENGAAYIVMEYVDGITLKQYVKDNGKMDAEKIFWMMMPLMKTLGAIHKQGVIHRDISSDNIMVMPDGSLKLIDFGAAKANSVLAEVTHSIVLKQGYAPVEQYSRDGKQGPWTDVYGVCATIYECITGKIPTAATQRTLGEALEMPSKLEIAVEGKLEKVLEQGLSLRPEDRYASMEELRMETEKALITEKKKRMSGWMAVSCMAAGVLCLLAAVGLYFYLHPELYRFRGIVTETVLFWPDDEMTANGYLEARQAIEDKFRILAGEGNYIMQDREDGTIEVTAPLEAYHGKDVWEVCRDYISRPASLTAYGYQDISSDALCRIAESDILEVHLETGTLQGMARKKIGLPTEDDCYYAVLTLSKEKAKEVHSLANEDGWLRMGWNIRVSDLLIYKDWIEFYVKAAADDETFYLVSQDQEEVFQELLIYNLTHPPIEKSLYVRCEIPAEWEEPEKIAGAGENQRPREEFEKNSICVRYACSDELSDGEWMDMTACFKKRLDALGVPYAFGNSPGKRDEVVVMFSPEGMCEDAVVMAGWGNGRVSVSDKWETVFSDYEMEDMEFLPEGLGNYVLKVYLSSYEQGQLLEELEKADDKEWYLNINGYRIAKCSLETDVEEDALLFKTLCSYGQPGITDENISILRLIKEIALGLEMPQSYSQESVCWFDADGRLEKDMDGTGMYSMKLGEERLEEVQEKLQEVMPGASAEADTKSTYEYPLRVLLPAGEDFPVSFLEAVQKVYEACDLGNGDYDFIEFIQKDEHGEEQAEFSFHKWNRGMSGYAVLTGEGMEKYLEEIKDLEQKSVFYRELVNMENQDRWNEWR